MSSESQFDPEEFLSDCREFIGKISSYDENTSKSDLCEAVTSINERIATLNGYEGTATIIQDLLEQEKHIHTLLFGAPHINEYKLENIDMSNLEYLGHGSYGTVYFSVLNETDVVAVKLVSPKDRTEEGERQFWNDFEREASTMSRSVHGNVVSLRGVIREDIVLKGDIVRELRRKGYEPNPSWKNDDGSVTFKAALIMEEMVDDARSFATSDTDGREKFRVALDAARGLYFLHDKPFSMIHRDVKPDNILISLEGVAKISDFAFARILLNDERDRDEREAYGTLPYIAPEVLNRKKLTQKIDVYAFGITLFYLFSGERAFNHFCEGFTKDGAFHKNAAVDGYRPDSGNVFDEYKNCGIRELMERCWSPSRRHRPTMKDVFNELKECFLSYESMKLLKLSPADLGHPVISSALSFWRRMKDCLGYPFYVRKNTLFKLISGDWKSIPSFFFKDRETVSFEDFLLSSNWFPFWFGDDERLRTEFRTLLTKDYFHGMISKDVSDGRLNKRPEGCFLIRCSETISKKDKICPLQTPFTLSYVHGESVANIRIHRNVLESVTERDCSRLGRDFYSITIPGLGRVEATTVSDLVSIIQRGTDDEGAILSTPCPKKRIQDPY